MIPRGSKIKDALKALKARPILVGYPDREIGFHAIVLLLDDLGVGVEPGQGLAIAGGQGQPPQLAAGAQQFRRGQEQAVHPLARQRGDGNDFLLARRLRLDPLALVGREQIDLVPRLDPRRATLAGR